MFSTSTSTHGAEITLEQRSRVWNSLSSCLQGLPRRNILLLAGDFNTSLLHEPGVAGGGCLRHDNPPPDSHLLAELSSQQGLCAVNTWCSRKSVDMHTYERGEQRTQIDYIFLRRMHADGLARRIVPTRSLNLTPWRHGARHMALKLSMPVHPGWRGPQLKKPGHVEVPKYNKTALDQAVRDRDAQFQRLVSTVQAGLLRYPQPAASNLNALLIQACEEIFPSQQARRNLQKAKVNLALRGIMKV